MNPISLVVEDIHETRDGIEKLLMVDGYQVRRRETSYRLLSSALTRSRGG
jgi:hypothetical protein